MTDNNKWTEEEMEFLRRLQTSIKENSSQKFEYKKDEHGHLIWPTKITRTYHQYISLGENLEADSYGMLIRDDYESTYIFCYPHLRNTVEVSNSFLAEMLSKIRSFLLANLSEANWSVEDINKIPKDLKFKMPTIIVDPGMVHHYEGRQRDAGIRVGALPIWYNDFPTTIETLLNSGISLHKLLTQPNQYYEQLRIPNVEPVNKMLGQLKAQKSKIQRLQHINDIQMRTPGKFDFEVEFIHYIPGDMVVGQGTYEYLGRLPILRYEIHHDPSSHGKVNGEWDYPYHQLDKKEDGDPRFVLHIPKKFERMFENPDNGSLNKQGTIKKFKEDMDTKYEKLGITTFWYKINFEFVYDL